MNVFPTVYLAVFLYGFSTVLSGLCSSGLCPVRAVSAPSPRGRYGKFVALQRKRRQIATFNQNRIVRSGQCY